jgi:hypothetical protein
LTAFWIFYVANGRKTDSLQKLLSSALNKLLAEKVLCITRLETVLQVLQMQLVVPRLTPLPTNRARTCKMILWEIIPLPMCFLPINLFYLNCYKYLFGNNYGI